MKTIRILIFASAVLIIGNSQVLLAKTYSQGNIEIYNIWTRTTPGRAKTAAVYIERIYNSGQQADHLVRISSTLAKKNLIHRTIVEDGIAKMVHVKELKVHAGHSLSFQPGRLHIMMLGIQKSLNGGDSFPMTLEFKKAGKIEIIVEVREMGLPPKMKMDHKKNHQH